MAAREDGLPREDPVAIDLEALSAALGSFEAREEDLCLTPAPGIGRPGARARAARLAGVDGDGRAVLVLAALGEEAVLAAIDALAWCDAHGDLLARRLDADPELVPCVVLVLQAVDEPVLAALSTLRIGGLRVFAAREVRGARGTGRDLVELARAAQALDLPLDEAWDLGLDEHAQGLATRIQAGLSRIDPDLRSSATARAIVWRHGRAVLATLRVAAGRLEAEVAGERIAVTADGDVERVHADALRAYLDAARRSRGAEPHPSRPASAPRGTPRREGIDDAQTTPRTPLMPAGPLLSADELAALRGEL